VTDVREISVQGCIIAIISLLLIFLQPAYANGGHVHLGGIFFLILGVVIFLGGLLVVLYFLLRPAPDESRKEPDV
jgi:Kef-type K+ transport system membrane component KefB